MVPRPIALVVLSTVLALTSPALASAISPAVRELPSRFEPNLGQTDPPVKFLARNRGLRCSPRRRTRRRHHRAGRVVARQRIP